MALYAASEPSGFGRLAGSDLVAPPLMWSEAVSALHRKLWRGGISDPLASATLDRLLGAPVRREQPDALHREAWSIARTLGWAKTYDAEYVALARILGCRLLTMDQRLLRGAGRLAELIGPTDLESPAGPP